MVDFGDKKKNNKFHESTVFKKSKKKGFIQVHSAYLLQELQWMKQKTTLRDCQPSNISGERSSSCQMIDHLLFWMAQRKKPIELFWVNEYRWKQWIDLKKDHWIVDHNKRSEMLKKGLI